MELQRKFPVRIVEQKANYTEMDTFFFTPLEQNSPYDKLLARAKLTLTSDFPSKSPSVGVEPGRFYHPNIDIKSGSVCVDQLNSSWTSTTTLLHVLEIVLPQLLIEPNSDDPLNPEAAKMLNSEPEKFKTIAKCKAQNHSSAKLVQEAKQMCDGKLPAYFVEKLKLYGIDPDAAFATEAAGPVVTRRNGGIKLVIDTSSDDLFV